MKTWKIGIIGCGDICEKVYLPQMSRLENAVPTAVFSKSPERAREIAEKFHIPQQYSDIDQMLEQGDFEIAMSIGAAEGRHEINRKILSAGKHLYSQKPFAQTAGQATEQIALAEKMGVKLSAAPVHMLRPELRRAKRMLDRGLVGDISLAKISMSHGGPEYYQMRASDPSWFYRQGTGALWDMGIHGITMLTGLLGPAREVSCMAAVSESERTVRGGPLDGLRVKSDMVADNYIVSMGFGSKLGLVDTGYIQKASKTSGALEIYGSKGTLVIGGGVGYRGVAKLEVYLDCPDLGVRGWMEPLPDQEEDFFQCQCVSDLIEAIEKDKKPRLSPEHGRHVIEILEGAEQSIREKRIVPLGSGF